MAGIQGSTMSIGRLADVPVRLHWSFLGLVGAYATYTLVGSGLASAVSMLMIVTGLFTSVLLHELGHSLAARRFDIGTAHITLYPFGGIATLERIPDEPREELLVALAGPAMNFALLVFFVAAWSLTGMVAMAGLALINLIMGVFNLIPAYPMDGGRVLRAALATWLGWFKASTTAMDVGEAFAWGFLFLGAGALQPNLVLVGGFLMFTLRSERQRLEYLLAETFQTQNRLHGHISALGNARLRAPHPLTGPYAG